MDADLAVFLAPLMHVFEEDVVWGGGKTPFHVTTYLTDQLPPLDYVTSVRAIVSNAAMEVLACKNTDGETHIVPGGRREAGETLEETLRREVLEETGWHISGVSQLGLWHFHHLGPRREGYRFPYPDFLQLIYRATAAYYDGAKRVADDYEVESGFISLPTLAITRFEQPSQMLLVEQALRRSAA